MNEEVHQRRSYLQKDRVKTMIKAASEKWSNEQREIQSPSMHSSRTKNFVHFMKTYTIERVYVDLNDHVRTRSRFLMD